MKVYDALILGGGCSGLSLAMVAASSPRLRKRIAVLEPRSSYHDDRTWCFWDVHKQPHEDLIRQRWSRWQVTTPSSTTTSAASAYSYCQIRSGDFYKKAERVIRASENCELLMGTAVQSLRQTMTGWEVTTNAGKWHAPLVFDSRPPQSTTPTMWQHFVGWRVEFTADCLVPEVALLMDFRPTDQDGIHFVYVLPESRRTALVESTFFGSAAFSQQTYEAILKEYLNQMARVADYRIVSRESGCIPMGAESQPRNQQKGLVDIGTRAGCIKPSSGYGFLNIQRHTQAIMRQWESQEPVVSPPVRESWMNWMDRVFLNWLQTHPEKAPQMFYNLFRRVPPDALVRFLSEQPNLSDVIKVVSAMPRTEFLVAAIRNHASSTNK
jgi:lycopene beta-cyclase